MLHVMKDGGVQGGYDVAIVGYGPVGQLAAILLGGLGREVGVFERWPDLYPRPRAVHYDDEVARIFQRIGIAAQLGSITEPATTYEWQNAAGQTLLLLDRSEPGSSGWPAATMFTQPQLERLLDEAAKATPSVHVHQGWEVGDVGDAGDLVQLSVRRGEVSGDRWLATGEEREVTAAYVIGCDGANSLVRERMGTPVEDLGFAFDWLIADTIPHDPGLLGGVNLQRCDPARPTTLVSGGPGRRRWEWMLLPGETAQQVEDRSFVWSLLAQSGIGEADVTLERHAVYTFRARWAERWRDGRMLLAGDAAHQMPPFAGQGMCSGMRDAFTLAWHLDLVLGGLAGESTLDAYTTERRGHLQHAIALSVELGKVICIADEAQAAARDELLLAAAADPGVPAIEPPAPNLGPGIVDSDADGVAGGSAAGRLFPQASVRTDAGERLLLEDTIDGGGFTLYALDADPASLLDADAAGYLRRLSASFVELDGGLDAPNAYGAWLAAHECTIALVRPDFYVFGTASTAEEASELVRRLRSALSDQTTSEGKPR
jgi:2-polyprenyl-6-methoxyphenol hydroxylase-like FAD-dependent oxidoreductase